MSELILDIYKNLSKHPKRLNHVIEVSNVAGAIGKHYNLNTKDLKLAGLIHDYAKYMDINFYQKFISANLLEEYKSDTYMYHAISASNYFKEKYQINDNIYHAVYNHVTGRANMSSYEKIIFISDSIYFNNKNKTNAKKLYLLALKDLDLAVLETIKLNQQSLKNKGLELSNLQLATLNYYKELTWKK